MKVDPNNKDTFIRKVRAGSDPDQIAIVIRQSPDKDCLVCWDIQNQLETNAYDVGKKHYLFFDD